jgi:hypothetical protein
MHDICTNNKNITILAVKFIQHTNTHDVTFLHALPVLSFITAFSIKNNKNTHERSREKDIRRQRLKEELKIIPIKMV